ncbi:MAG: PKD domain-containing protein, partial [Euryarchaeota archaeon]|nr:PKD domain-containing protein [Euryarchaeota archaeon]
MRRLAIAVLFSIIIISTMLPGMTSTSIEAHDQLPLEMNPGILDEGALFDRFTHTVVVRANPIKHVVADLNNDSRYDLAIIYHGSTVLDIFLANSSHCFSATPSQTITFNWQPTGLAAGDMDRDGKDDLVVCFDYDSGENIIICYQKNDFSATFPAAKYLYNSMKQKDVIVHDLNYDGWLDIVALYSMDDPGFQAGFAVYRSTTPNNYSLIIKPLPSEMYSPALMAMGDINADGFQDLVIADPIAKKVVGYRNDATTGSSFTQIDPLNDVVATAIMIEELAGDAREELVLALAKDLPTTETPVIRILRYSNSTGMLDEFVDDVPNQSGVTGMVGVLNDPGTSIDLARTSDDLHDLTVFNTPTGTAVWRYSNSISSPTPSDPVSLLSQDMNGDGRDDLLVLCNLSSGSGTLTVFYHTGTAISNANDNLVTGSFEASLVASGNFDGDASTEMVYYNWTSNRAYFYRTSAVSLGYLPAPHDAEAIMAADLNGDGSDELVWSNATSISIWWGGSNFLSSTSYSTLAPSMTPRSLGFGDVNGDGFEDLIAGCFGGVEVYWNSGTAIPFDSGDRTVLSLTGAEITEVKIGKFSGTGDTLADLAVVNTTSGRIEIYHQQSSLPMFSYSARTLLTIVPNIGGLVCADFNWDGMEDLATHSVDTLYLFEQYAGGFSGAPEFPVKFIPGQGIDGIAIGDLDDMGNVEVALVSGNSTLMAYHYDGASSTLISITDQTVGSSPLSMLVCDMDGDGKDDLVAYSMSSRTTSFFYQNNFPPLAQGQAEGSGFLEGIPVWFNANGSTDSASDMDRLNYTWDFDDGAIGYGKRIAHNYTENGQYNVTLTVSDPWGESDETAIHVVVGDRSPAAEFSFQEEPAPEEGRPVRFYDLSTSPVDDIVGWEWSFGDGVWLNQTSSQPVYHNYERNGTFTVTLTVHDNDGSSSSVSHDIVVADSSPTADFHASITSPLEGQQVAFTDASQFTADGLVHWSWNLGDGNWRNVTDNASFFHTYAYSGNFTVTLTVTDLDGSEDSVSVLITVRNSPPAASFTVSVPSPAEGEQIAFTDASSFEINPIVHWSWDLGDGTWVNWTSANRPGNGTVQHTYADNGTYPVTLTVTDLDGDVSTSVRTMVVKDTDPVISMMYTVSGASSFKEWDDVAVEVIATAQWGDIVGYEWSFETLTFQAALGTDFNSAVHRYNSSGNYRIFVRAWDVDSYVESSIQITITDPAPVPDFTAAVKAGSRTIDFSAALTLDTENDKPWLMYRWFFGDNQETDWSRNDRVNHTYQQDGVYSVRLEVRDDRNPSVMKTVNVTIDLLPPVISMDDPVL